MSRSVPLPEPDFSASQGWHRDGGGYRIPGCAADLTDRRERAWRGFVLRIRCAGERIAAVQLQAMEPTPGGVLMLAQRFREGWDAQLYDIPNVETPLLTLEDARLVRQGPDFRQYVGLERIGRDLSPQTWLCTTTPERMAEILARMVQQDRR
jgi:hypothetical protein